MNDDQTKVKRTVALIGLPVLAILVGVIGVLALLSAAHTPQTAASGTATSAASPTIGATATASGSPTFTPSPSLPGNDWATYRSNTSSTGVNDEPIITQSNVSGLTQVWKGDTHQAYMGASAIVGSTVYVANGTTFFALDLHTGKQLWTVAQLPQSKGPITDSVGVDAQLGLAYFGTSDAQVYAINIRTGKIAWHTSIGDPAEHSHVWGSPLIINGHIYIGLASLDDLPCIRGGIFSLDEKTGAIDWKNYTIRDGHIGGGVWGTFAANPANQEIVVATGNPCPVGANNPTIDETDAVLGVDWNTGQTLWQFTSIPNDDCDCDFGQGPVDFTYQGQEEVIAGNKLGWVYGLRPPATRTGTPTLLWKIQIADTGYYQQGGIYEPPTYQSGVAYVAGGPTPDGVCPQGSLNAIRVTDGTVLWRNCTSGQVVSASALSNGMLFVAEYNKVVAYDLTNGNTLWSASYQSEVWGGLALAHGHLIVPLVTGNLICFAIPGVSP